MASNPEFECMWNEAVESWLNKTQTENPEKSSKKKIEQAQKERQSKLAVLQSLRLRSAEDLQAEIEKRSSSFDDHRNPKKFHNLWTSLQSCIRPVAVLGNVIQSALGATPFAPAATVFGAALFLVQSAQGVSDAYDWVSDLLSHLANFSARLDEYTKAPNMSRNLQKKVLEILIAILDIFAIADATINTGRFAEYLKVTFMGKDDKVAAAMSKLSSLLVDEQAMVIAVTYATTQGTKDAVQSVANIVESTDAKTDTIIAYQNDARTMMQQEAEKRQVKEALGQVDSSAAVETYHGILEDMLEGSGEWIVKERLFKKWVDRIAPIMWIFGGPGAGKSFLSTFMISYLEKLHPTDPQHSSSFSVSYFYIKESNQQMRSLITVLRSLSSQIAKSNIVYRRYVASFGDSIEKISTAKGIWHHLFLGFFTSTTFDNNFAAIVIDGVDEAEAEDRECLMKLLKSLQETMTAGKPARIQIALVGRPNLRNDIAMVWGDDSWQDDKDSISVAGKNSADISKYILENINKILLLRPKKLLPLKAQMALKALIINTLTEGANGMFMWVKLMIDQIKGKGRPQDIHIALKAAPRELNEMIRHVFNRIADDPDFGTDIEKQDLNGILTWVTCAERPLLLGEMRVLMMLRPVPKDDELPAPDGEDEVNGDDMRVEGMPLLKERLKDSYAVLFTLTKDEDRMGDGSRTFDTDQPPTSTKDSNDDEARDEEDGNNSVEDEGDCIVQDDNIDLGWETATIEFSHASIRQYLRDDGALETPKGLSDFGIGIQLNHAELDIATTCLQILCDEKHEIRFKGFNMMEYAADYYVKHLGRIKRTTLSRPEKVAVLRPLLALYREERVIDRWMENASRAQFFQLCLGPASPLPIVQEWFQEGSSAEEFDNEFSSEEQLWMQKASKSAKDLLKQWCIYSGYRWLKPMEWIKQEVVTKVPVPLFVGCEFQVLFLYYYHNLDDDTNSGEKKNQELILERLSSSDIPASRIKELAESTGLEKTALWHSRLGETLVDSQYNDEAMNQYQIAIKMSEQDWTIMTGLAICYAERKEYYTAIEWELKACAAFPPELEEFKYYYLQKISKWRHELKDVEGAVETAKEAYMLQKESLIAMNTYIEALNAASRYEEIIDFAESLQEGKSEISGNNHLTDLLSGYHTVHDIIGNAAREAGKLDFMRHAIDTAIVSALGKGFIRQAAAERFALANFNFRYADKEDEAMQLWEEIYESVKDKNESIPIWSQLRTYCSDSLAERYFNKATNARDRGEPTDDWVSKLRKLAMHHKGAKKGGYSTNNAASILGAWYHSIGNEKEAKACFKPKMLEAIAMLFDDDPRNDSSGYAALAGILLLAGRRAEAGAAFSIVLAPSDTTKDNNLEYIYGCDGPCHKVSKECAELHFCTVCLNATVFCEKCIGLVKSNKLGYRKCSSGHEFFMAYPIAEKIEDPNMIKMNGKTMLIKDWLAELKSEWT